MLVTPPATAPVSWIRTYYKLLLPLAFAGIAVLISTSLYQAASGEFPWQSSFMGDPAANPFLPLYLFNVALVLLIAVTYLMLQIRSRVLDLRTQIDEEKSSFIRMAADTIRTPLTSLRWLTELLLEGDLGEMNERQRQSITRMNRAIERLIAQANEMLKIMKLSGGMIVYHPHPTDVNVIVGGAVDDVQSLASAKEQTITVQRTYEGEVVADPSLIRHVVGVLLSHAVSLSPMHSTIAIASKADDRDATITITYAGREINPKYDDEMTDVLPHTMHPHHQHDAEPANLSVSQEIMHAAGGRLQFTTHGQHHELSLTLPRPPSHVS